MRRYFHRIKEEVSFLDQWHFIDDVYPEDAEIVWFTAKDKMYLGSYKESQGAFILADGEGISLNDVCDWKYLGSDRKVACYPKEKEIVAAEVPGLASLVVGIFTDHAVDEDTGDEVSAILLDDIYVGLPECIAWSDVFAWWRAPKSPAERVVIKNLSVETPEIPDMPLEVESYDPQEDLIDYVTDAEELAAPAEEVPAEIEVSEVPAEVPFIAEEKAPVEDVEIQTPEAYTSEIKAAKDEEEEPRQFESYVRELVNQEKLEERKQLRRKIEKLKEREKRKNATMSEIWDENDPSLPKDAREFARWYHHDLLGIDYDNLPEYENYKGQIIVEIDDLFSKYLTEKQYSINKDVGVLYSRLPAEGKEAFQKMISKYKKLAFGEA